MSSRNLQISLTDGKRYNKLELGRASFSYSRIFYSQRRQQQLIDIGVSAYARCCGNPPEWL
jgi:hypothetical protein